MSDEEHWKALVSSLMVSQVTETERSASLLSQLEQAEAELSEAKVAGARDSATLEGELASLRDQNEMHRDMAALARSEVAQLEADLRVSQHVLSQVATQGEELIRSVCTLLLQAQEYAAMAPRIETAPKQAASGGSDPAAVMAANFAAAVHAFNNSVFQTEHLIDSVCKLSQPLASFRDVMRAATRPADCAPAVAPPRIPTTTSVNQGWLEQLRQQRRRELEADESTAHAPEPDGAVTCRRTALLTNGSVARHASATGGPDDEREWLPRRTSSPDARARQVPEEEEYNEREEAEADEAVEEDESTAVAAAAAAGEPLVSTKFEVVVPEEASPGDTLYVALPSGDEVKVIIPPGVPAGSVLTCSALMSASSAPSIPS